MGNTVKLQKYVSHLYGWEKTNTEREIEGGSSVKRKIMYTHEYLKNKPYANLLFIYILGN